MVANLMTDCKRDCNGVLGNYRSLSLLFISGKVVEITEDRISRCWEKYKLLTQHCFCKRESCLRILFEFYKGLGRHENYGDLVDLFYLNCQKPLQGNVINKNKTKMEGAGTDILLLKDKR